MTELTIRLVIGRHGMEVNQLTACARHISCRDFICLAGLRTRVPGDDSVLVLQIN